ncbi:retinoic acid receptor responder protein 2 [Aotus nancymaae]|uniref:retinoic acid receptor responder protein 2 n=1 Tax=Aotus nancymaae TaxID=37293 RepID=UPI0030FE01BB
MRRLLIPLALWLGAVGAVSTELTEAQERGLQVALEEFHKHPPVQWTFQKICVYSAEDTPFPAGIFVRLEFKLQQTDCRKEDWKKPHCKVKPNGRKRKCLACIKLGPENKVLGRMIHCPTKTQVLRELKEYQENQCIKVQQAGEDPNSFGFPGNAALLQGPAQH